MIDFQNSFTAAARINFADLLYWSPWQPFLFPLVAATRQCTGAQSMQDGRITAMTGPSIHNS
jgi:hypothetical protein